MKGIFVGIRYYNLLYSTCLSVYQPSCLSVHLSESEPSNILSVRMIMILYIFVCVGDCLAFTSVSIPMYAINYDFLKTLP